MLVDLLKLIRLIEREALITWRTIGSDYNTTLIPITTHFLFAASQRPEFSSKKMASALFSSLMYGIPYIAQFCLSNQLHNVEEDKIEKPFRPLAAGLITYRGAVARYLLWNIIFIANSRRLKVTKWAALWIAATIFHNFLGGDKNFFTKNIVTMTLGTAAQFGAAWDTFHPSMPNKTRAWMHLLSLWIGVMANIQDFRDIEGDLKINRKTLPIILGDNASRSVMALVSIGAGGLLFKTLRRFNPRPLPTTINLGLVGWHLLLAKRLYLLRSRTEDQKTYKTHLSFMYCVVVLSSFIFLRNQHFAASSTKRNNLLVTALQSKDTAEILHKFSIFASFKNATPALQKTFRIK